MEVYHSGDDRVVGFRGGSGCLNSTFEGKSLCLEATLDGGDSSVSYPRSSTHRKEHDRGNRPLKTKHKECVHLQGMWIHLQVFLWSLLCLILALGLSSITHKA